MRRTNWFRTLLFLFASVLGLGLAPTAQPQNVIPAQRTRNPATEQARLSKQVRHELVMLPYLGVFDHLAFRLNGDRVTLLGYLTRPSLSSDAENVVKLIEGVARVKNQIEVLPVSPADDRLRIALYRSIYGSSTLSRYAVGSGKTIHIIVNHGHVILEGVVSSEMDRNIAGIQANGVPFVFSVKNNLRISKG